MSRRYHTNTTTESNIYSDINIPSNLLDTDNLFEEQWGGMDERKLSSSERAAIAAQEVLEDGPKRPSITERVRSASWPARKKSSAERRRSLYEGGKLRQILGIIDDGKRKELNISISIETSLSKSIETSLSKTGRKGDDVFLHKARVMVVDPNDKTEYKITKSSYGLGKRLAWPSFANLMDKYKGQKTIELPPQLKERVTYDTSFEVQIDLILGLDFNRLNNPDKQILERYIEELVRESKTRQGTIQMSELDEQSSAIRAAEAEAVKIRGSAVDEVNKIIELIGESIEEGAEEAKRKRERINDLNQDQETSVQDMMEAVNGLEDIYVTSGTRTLNLDECTCKDGSKMTLVEINTAKVPHPEFSEVLERRISQIPGEIEEIERVILLNGKKTKTIEELRGFITPLTGKTYGHEILTEIYSIDEKIGEFAGRLGLELDNELSKYISELEEKGFSRKVSAADRVASGAMSLATSAGSAASAASGRMRRSRLRRSRSRRRAKSESESMSNMSPTSPTSQRKGTVGDLPSSNIWDEVPRVGRVPSGTGLELVRTADESSQDASTMPMPPGRVPAPAEATSPGATRGTRALRQEATPMPMPPSGVPTQAEATSPGATRGTRASRQEAALMPMPPNSDLASAEETSLAREGNKKPQSGGYQPSNKSYRKYNKRRYTLK